MGPTGEQRASEAGRSGPGELDGLDPATRERVAALVQREREARFRVEAALAEVTDCVELAPDLLCACEVGSLRLLRCNQTMVRAVGRPRHELLGRSLLELIQPASHQPTLQALDRLAAVGTWSRPTSS